ncbi:helix-turn-helix domain-containing protein [Streptomyces sp. NPDC094143]|uniref:helix-turn-helix domain-containing protein n=1 Tax=Streptomyces sp. NPDC094143 TaxID=3155310 RepID=UPI0033210DA4
MSESTAAGEFAALLGELKERSGLSYGVLAKRLHMSTSTLHRYCNGDAVPTDYAPVERLARLCKASPRELVELHRRWVLADAVRGRKGGAGADAVAGSVVDEEPVADRPWPGAGEPPPGDPEPVAEQGVREGDGSDGDRPEPAGDRPDSAGPGEGAGEEERPERAGEVLSGGSAGRRPRRPRPAVLAGVALAVVLGGVGLAVAVPSGGTDGDGRHGSAAAPDSAARPDGSAVASVSPSGRSPSPSGPGREEGKGKDKAKGAAASSGPSAPATGAARPGRDTAPASGPAPLSVDTEPHAWEGPCSQRYLVNLPPDRVVPPPLEQDAPGWVAAMDAVPSGEQLLKVTVQGTGDETVILKGLAVRMAGKRAPLAWNDYAMGYPGVGCGGGVPTRLFTVALDAARPAVVPESGQDDFPFKVTESDPEVYYIRADASAYDVSWYLELRWSSGSRQGTLTVDDKGRPFRTSGNNGRPAYEFPLGGEKWVKAGTTGAS